MNVSPHESNPRSRRAYRVRSAPKPIEKFLAQVSILAVFIGASVLLVFWLRSFLEPFRFSITAERVDDETSDLIRERTLLEVPKP